MQCEKRIESLVLLATCKPWSVPRAIEELGDALYAYDRDVCIDVDEVYPLLYVYSSVLKPSKVFMLIVQEPPAYVERIIPVDMVYNTIILNKRDIEVFAARLAEFVRAKGVDSVNVEARKRNYYIKTSHDNKSLTNLISNIIANNGIRVLRRSSNALRVEDSRHGIVIGLILEGSDRLRYWRLKRLNTGLRE
jgi:hypothetical protein